MYHQLLSLLVKGTSSTATEHVSDAKGLAQLKYLVYIVVHFESDLVE